jgi:aspartate/methionine/tyrosine aminotransferase
VTDPRNLKSDYMHFAKFGTAAKYNIASSGVKDALLSDLDLDWGDLALHGPNAGGYQPLKEKIAARFGVDASHVVMPGGGCSFSNHLAMAAMVAPGDRVVVEDPTYELLIDALRYLQADVHRFQRKPEEAWRLDPDRVAEALTPDTRLVVITNLHNPSSALESEATIHAVAEVAARVGAMVLVDEVYLELMFKDGQARTSFRPTGNIVITSSLTKAYGVTGLRCGWILAPAELATKMNRLNDLYGVHPPHIAERMSVVALDRLPHLRARASSLIDVNRAAYRELLDGHEALEQSVFDQGTTVFPRLKQTDGDALFRRMMQDFETSIVPGRFFNRPNHIRVGLGGDVETTRIGLQRLAEALQI